MKDIQTSKSAHNPAVKAGLELPLMEAFYTIQGEGEHSGLAAYFLRIGGCDVGCHWCDVKESWNPDIHPVQSISSIVESIPEGIQTVVITGGEPLTWNMEPLTQALHEKGYTIHVETSGAYPYTGSWDWVCLSPKKRSMPREEYFAVANELKVIVYNNKDLEWAEQLAAKVGKQCSLLLQPEWSKRETAIPAIVDYVMSHPKWKVSLQTHKYMHIP